MAETLDILVAGEVDLEGLAGELEKLVGVPLERRSDAGEVWFAFDDERVHLSADRHELVNDRDMAFEDYPLHVAVSARNLATDAERHHWRTGFARELYEGLRATGRYRLMLVRDLQEKLEEFDPADDGR